jgi:hypothetical protein
VKDTESQPQTVINIALNYAPRSVTTTETAHPDGTTSVTTTTVVSPLLLDAAQMAEALGISLRTLQSLTDLGRVPVHYVGASPRYVVAEVAHALLDLPRSPEKKPLQVMAKRKAADALLAAASQHKAA